MVVWRMILSRLGANLNVAAHDGGSDHGIVTEAFSLSGRSPVAQITGAVTQSLRASMVATTSTPPSGLIVMSHRSLRPSTRLALVTVPPLMLKASSRRTR